MRTALRNHAEVAHVWAQQTQSQGRSGNMFFDGPAIYSYGRHYCIAAFVDTPAGRVVLFNANGYSVSTAKHRNYTRGALREQIGVFTVPSTGYGRESHYGAEVRGVDHVANVEHYLKAVEDERGAALRARRWASHHESNAERLALELGRYLGAFGTKALPVELRKRARALEKLRAAGELFSESERAKMKTAAREAKARDAADKARKAAEALEELGKWQRGERDGVPYVGADVPTALRLKDGRIETSRGAQITERTARELWAALCRGLNVAGLKLDVYTVTSWDGAALRVGCHSIPRAELVRLAGLLKLPGELGAWQPKTGAPCGCRPGQERDNCPSCEGTGQRIDFAAIRARRA